MVFFFNSDSQLDTFGLLNMYDLDGGKFFHHVAQGTKSILEMDFLKVFTADGVDYFSTGNSLPPSFLSLMPLQVQNFSFPAALAVCQSNSSIVARYSSLKYDPSLNAVFVADPPPSATLSLITSHHASSNERHVLLNSMHRMFL